jgi:hypothetical protein
MQHRNGSSRDVRSRDVCHLSRDNAAPRCIARARSSDTRRRNGFATERFGGDRH